MRRMLRRERANRTGGDVRMSVTYHDVTQAASALVSARHEPDVRVALVAGILSSQKAVNIEERQISVLRPLILANELTRDEAELYRLISAHGMVSHKQCEAILDVMSAYDEGRLAHLQAMPQDMRGWDEWRKEVAKMKCLSWKTASFVAGLMWPFYCPFVPIDSHVCARLGKMSVYRSGKLSSKSRPSYRLYRSIERTIWREWVDAGRPLPSLFLWHWFKWEEWRQSEGDSTVEDGAQSHEGLRAW
jgi:hypothetical protein